ncbi:mechanosensitive ion channel domain-containing protein [Tranquillimonas alkanivorans]|uniref:Small-conductance mechanosensitive channel n=1 Tax=Tranquillimonas alkanivorans TaxID=441119 RepID=A0A1I5RU57_9RHOB|nr:mechanosensitive ion channel domain-containing protein [Tranquillimonas alkanivorans]SFP61927.1 Small-conductance mechanosensitive channel [Tranquillimonas alkanivorans]
MTLVHRAAGAIAAFVRPFAALVAVLLLVAGLAAGQLHAQDAVADPAATDETAAGDPADLLLEILRDEESLNRLIEGLEARAGEAVEAVEEPLVEPVAPASFGRRLAVLTQEAAQDVARSVESLWRALERAPRILSSVGADEMEVIWDAFRELILIIAITVVVFLVLRAALIPVYRRMGARASNGSPGYRIMAFLGSGLLDVLIVVAAWAIGYAVAISFFGEFGEIGIRQTLYLNAFLAVELVKTAVRLVLSPSTGHLRIVPMSDAAAKSLMRVVNISVSVLGYGQLLIVPIVNANASYLAGRGISALLSSLVMIYLALVVLARRKGVADWLLAQTMPVSPPPSDQPDPALDDEESVDEEERVVVAGTAAEVEDETTEEPVQTAERKRRRRSVLAPVARNWHWFALAYLAGVLLLVLSRPGPVVFEVLLSSGKIALALIVGVVLSGILGRVISRGISLPESARERLPLLEGRLNRFVPQALTVVRLVIMAAVALYALDVIGVMGVSSWLDGERGVWVAGTVVSVALILLVAFLLWLALNSWVDYRLNPDFGKVATPREQTLLTLLRNAATITIIVLTLMFVLSEMGLNIGPLIASAGVLGLAIGFGAQKLVQDIITGVFIQFENAINVGDVVTAGGTTGVVEKLTVRSVSLRDLQGVFHIVPFSSVDMVSNFTREFSYYVVDMGVAYRENVDEVKQAMFDAYEDLRADPEQGPFLMGDLEWFGLDAFGDSAVVLRCRIKTLPGKQWGVGRAYNEVVKRVFDARNIEIPFPHQTIYFGEDKQGNAPPVHVARIGRDRADAAE